MHGDIDFNIGVLDYRFSLKAHCPLSTRDTKVSFSFAITGDLLACALSDELADAVDYEKLALDLKQLIKEHDCTQIETLGLNARKLVQEFSPLIIGGFLSICVDCHDTFLLREELL